MKPERINQLIAEWEGWTQHLPFNLKTQGGWFDPNGNYRIGSAPYPDYGSDLNAIQRAVMRLSWNQLYDYYFKHLRPVVNPGGSCQSIGLFLATAAQRCESLLRTLGKWEE